MNHFLKERIKRLATASAASITGFFRCLASCLRMVLLSSVRVAFASRNYARYRKHNRCTLLANGPSLKEALEQNRVQLENTDLMCVNSFCQSGYFWELKPRFYCLIDGEFFHPTTERTQEQVSTLIQALDQVDWEMKLLIPSWVKQAQLLDQLQNPNISVLRVNSTTVEGWMGFCRLAYQLRLGMPACINVTIFGMMSAMNMGYSEIYLYGLDHNFTQQLFVDEDNVVCSRESHVYSSQPRVFRLENTSMAQILRNITLGFAIHERLQAYSSSIGCRILNCTRGSFVDAYEREKRTDKN